MIQIKQYNHFSQIIARALVLLFILSPLVACDDEVPDVPTRPITVGLGRDASMALESPEDYMMSGGSEQGVDMGETGGTTAGTMSGPCTQGEIRQLSGCGLERCLSGQWVNESGARELCNNHDDDCDGRVDESFSIGGMCFADNADGCRVEGTFACDLESQTAMCVPSSTISSRPEVCDGIDNDCDEEVDEGFEDGPLCCTDASHCPPGVMCVDGLCDEPTTTPIPPIDPMAPIGTCENPIWMPGFNVYFEDGNRANKTLAVANCTGNLADDLLLAFQTGSGSEIVFAFSLPESQRVQFTTELSLFASVVYVFEDTCIPEQTICAHCDQSILGLASEPARGVNLTFEAEENRLYYVVLDTKLDLVEILTLLGGGMDPGRVPFVLNFSAAN